MEIISLVSLVIILVILFFIFSTTPKKVEQFDATADLIFNQDEFVDFYKFNNREIKNAKYGSEGKNNVVTDIIKKNFEIWKSNRFRVTNDNMGGNPNAGEEKKLRIWF